MRLIRRSLTTLLLAAAFASPATALPPSLDRAPTTAMVTIAIPKLSTLDKDVTNLTTMLGLPGAGMGLDMILQAIGVEKGVNLDGSLSICVFPPKEGGDPDVVVIVPTDGYKDLIGNFGVEPKDGGVDSVMINGEQVFSRNIGGGFAAFGKTKGTIEAFEGKAGNAEAHKKMLGARAEALTDSADASIIINTPVARPLIEKNIKARMDDLANNPAAANMPPGVAEMGPKMLQTVFDNTNAIVAAFDAKSAGVGLDLAFSCKADGDFGKYLKESGNSAALLSKLPGGQFLVAAALDTSSPQLKALTKAVFAMIPKEQLGDNAKQFEQMVALIDKVDGQAAMIGFAPGGLSTGLFSSTVNYTATKDAPAVIASARAEMDAVIKADKATGKYEEASVDVGDAKVDSFELKMKPDDENPIQGQIMSGLFGTSGGPSGYVARVDGGVIRTFSKNSKLMADALKAAKGEGAISKDSGISQVAARLPKGRIAELYIGPKAILDTVKPFVGMIAPNLGAIEIPKNLPPIGLGLAPGESTLQASIYLPTPVLKFIIETVQQVGPPGMGRPAPGDAGQPSF